MGGSLLSFSSLDTSSSILSQNLPFKGTLHSWSLIALHTEWQAIKPVYFIFFESHLLILVPIWEVIGKGREVHSAD